MVAVFGHVIMSFLQFKLQNMLKLTKICPIYTMEQDVYIMQEALLEFCLRSRAFYFSFYLCEKWVYVMNKFDERYEIRLGTKRDIDNIMEFIDLYWKKGHILSIDRKLFEYEFLDGNQVNIQ